jgi:presenilin-like A22 family membrane protease
MVASGLDSRQNIRILTLFLIVQFAGLLLATQYFNGANVQQVSASSGQAVAGFPSITSFILVYIGVMGIATFILMFLMRRKSTKIFLLFEAITILIGSFFVFLFLAGIGSVYFPQIQILSNPNFQVGLAGFLSVVLLVSKWKNPRLRNTTSIISSVGLGLILGLNVSFPLALLFMGVIAIYDFIAVFITKHMVAMGQAAVDMNLALIVVTNEGEAIPSSNATKAQMEIYSKQKASLTKNYGQTMDELHRKNLIPIIRPRGLGNGDLAIPLMVAVAAYSTFLNFTVSMVIVLGSTFGLILTFLILDRYRRALPAIPPLLFGILIALGIYFLVA